ncbi:MGMT family protein [Thermogladius sp. 4427co]|uniref:MGMT family protein n=1 Tax=Thermogladius sp. 4427co TaxID=3450718 RepID=UPI003F78B879
MYPELVTGVFLSRLLVYENKRLRPARDKDLEEAVYIIVSSIPLGRVSTYNCIGRILGIHPRKVASILRKNQYPIIIPCHRVVYSDLRLGGYSRGGSRVKETLLRLEGVEVRNGRVLPDYLVDECKPV